MSSSSSRLAAAEGRGSISGEPNSSSLVADRHLRLAGPRVDSVSRPGAPSYPTAFGARPVVDFPVATLLDKGRGQRERSALAAWMEAATGNRALGNAATS